VRTCSCLPGYENIINGVDQSGLGIVGSVPFGTCLEIDECQRYRCDPPGNSAYCTNNINSRRCYCPPGTVPKIPSGPSFVDLPGSTPNTLLCDDLSDCNTVGCVEPVFGFNRSCTEEIGQRTCTCPTGLLGTTTIPLFGPFAGCFPGLRIGTPVPLGSVLGNDHWNDWLVSLRVDVNGDGMLDIVVALGDRIGWMESIAPGQFIEHITGAYPARAYSLASYMRPGTPPQFELVYTDVSGNLKELLLDASAEYFVTGATLEPPLSAGYIGQSHTSQTGDWIIYGQGRRVWNLATKTASLLSFDVHVMSACLFSDEISDAQLADIDEDGLLDLILAINPGPNSCSTQSGFYWWRQTAAWNFQWKGMAGESRKAAHFVAGRVNGPAKKRSLNDDLLAVTSNCYSLSKFNDFFSPATMTNTLVPLPSQDGSCETCGCGSSGGLIPIDFNNDGLMDLISIISGGAQIFINHLGTLVPQTLLVGCDTVTLFDMNNDTQDDLVCSAPGVAIWYPLLIPLSCEEGTHNCNSSTSECVDAGWNGYTCVCKDGFENNTGVSTQYVLVCDDINECIVNNTCFYPAGCKNTFGSFTCACKPGQKDVNGDCVDIDECTNPQEVHPNFDAGCDRRLSTCVNNYINGDLYACVCIDGYEPNTTQPNSNIGLIDPVRGDNIGAGYANVTQTCQDINECLGAHGCEQLCRNEIMSEENGFNGYSCYCRPGFQISGSTQRNCIPVICQWKAWTSWTPSLCGCGIVRNRLRAQIYIAGACTERQYIEQACSISDCMPVSKPSSLDAATTIIDNLLSHSDIAGTSNMVDEMFCDIPFGTPHSGTDCSPGRWKRVESTYTGVAKRQSLLGDGFFTSSTIGIFKFLTTNTTICPYDDAAVDGGYLVGNISQILTLPPSQIILTLPTASDTPATCIMTVDISKAYPYNAIPIIVGILVGLPLFLLLAWLAYLFVTKRLLERRLAVLSNLPDQVAKHYKDCIMNEELWEKLPNEPELFRKQLTEKEDIDHVQSLFLRLDGSGIVVSQIFAVYNPSLVYQMGLTWEKFENRVLTNPQMFYAEKWRSDETKTRSQIKQKAWVKETFVNRVAQFEWNQELSAPIIPTIHGTSAHVAWKVCQSGFATLSALDIGFFGAGIYFTTSAKYAVPYFATKPNPSIIISFLIPGNPFPVTEDPNDPAVSIAGHALKPGYQSHYVLTTNRGMPFPQIEYKNIFDELVIRQETQVAPAYVLMLDPKGFPQLIRSFERMTAEDDPTNFEDDN
jgi:hypothetical protein